MCLDLVSGHEQSESFLSQINVFKPKNEFKIQQNITILFHIKIFSVHECCGECYLQNIFQ